VTFCGERGRRPYRQVLLPSLFSQDGTLLAIPFRDHRGDAGVQLVDCVSGEEKGWYPAGGESDGVVSAFQPLGHTLFVGSLREKSIRLRAWDLSRKRESSWFHPKRHTPGSSAGLSCSPDGRYLLLIEETGLLRLLEPRTGADIRTIECDYPTAFEVPPTAFSPDGRSLAAHYNLGDDDDMFRRLGVFETWTGGCRWSVPLGDPDLTALVFHPDGKTLVSGHEDTSILLWDYRALPAGASAKPTPRELTSCWEVLRKPDAAEAFEAQKSLAAAGDAALVLLRDRLRPVPGGERDKILTRLVRDLEADAFEVRRQAFAKLQAEGPVAEAVLVLSLRTEPSPEARSRIRQLLEPLWQRRHTPDELQALRGVEVLEWIGSPEARRVVEGLARGRLGDRLTREAEATLARMKR
jgi:hypothetical protein